MVALRINRFLLCAGFVCLLFLQAGSLRADVQWRTSLREVALEAKQTGKPMLLKFTAEWCTFCHKMEKSFDRTDVSQLVNENFVPIKVDADENKKLVKEIGIDGFPTTVIISPDFQVLQKITGYLEADELKKRLDILAPVEGTGTAIVKKSNAGGAATQVAELPQNQIQQVNSVWAFEQICLVELVENANLTQGNPAFFTFYRDRQLCFATEAHKQAFEQNPEKYWPALNGVCPIQLANNKQMVPGSPQLGAIYRGQLWFFSSAEARMQFAQSPQKYLLPGVAEE
ncbi:MAG: thioredoxin fold domain-containing protein [Planctomycetaceae bacterium]